MQLLAYDYHFSILVTGRLEVTLTCYGAIQIIILLLKLSLVIITTVTIINLLVDDNS